MNSTSMKDILCGIGLSVGGHVYDSLQKQSVEERTAVYAETADDTIFQIDRDVEELIVPALEADAASVGGIVLIAEGIEESGKPLALPRGTRPEDAAWRVLLDPIDGTRGIMYDKRSAFFLAGAAPNRGAATHLRDITTAVMVEIPTSKSLYGDLLWAICGEGAHRSRRNLLTGEMRSLPITPSKSKTILGGFAQIARFFPPGRGLLAMIEEEMIEILFPSPPMGRAILFEDQYISTGGQLYEILVGHDRFVAELRWGLYQFLSKAGKAPGLTCHPYDVCAHRIGLEAGILITGRDGNPLDAPLDTVSPVDWIAYANEDIRSEVEPALQKIMCKYGLLEKYELKNKS